MRKPKDLLMLGHRIDGVSFSHQSAKAAVESATVESQRRFCFLTSVPEFVVAIMRSFLWL